jgi:hypothetical protein
MKTLYITVACAAILIAACGGGDSSSSVGPVAPAPSNGTVLTTTNAETAAQIAFQSMMTSADLVGLGGSIGISANGAGLTSKVSPKSKVSGFLVDILQKVPFGPDEIACFVSGTITVSGDITNPLTLSTGDTFSIDANACDDGAGETLDGLMSLTVTEFTGDISGLYLVAMDADLDALQVTTANDVISSTGDTSVSLDTRTALFVSATAGGMSMTTTTNSSIEVLTNYSIDQTVDANFDPASFALSAEGTVDSSKLSGVVSYSTPVTFEGLGLDYPDRGELLVTGSESTVRLIAVDNINVRIEVDSNGDETVDEAINTTWAALTSQD